MGIASLKLVGSSDRIARPKPTLCNLRGYRVEELGRAAMAKAYMAAPVVSQDGRISMREVTDTGGHLRLCQPIDPTQVIRLGDEIFGSTLTDVFFLDREPNRDRIAFSYELADGRYGTAVATHCA